MSEYNFKFIEVKWRKKWDEAGLFRVTEDVNRKKFYALIEFPYPSGAGLHCGHTRPFTALDVVSRLKRMQGYNVLFPIGYDEFGFPTEKYAINTGIHPAIATRDNTNNFTKQLKSLGYCFDWNRCIHTSNPEYFKWTQWMFIQFFKSGIAYRGHDKISWCDNCKIGLTNEELENGKCERCGGEVVQKDKSQWMLKMKSYSDKLLSGLMAVDYPDNIKKMQSNWIGKSVGCEIDFKVKIDDHEEFLTVFTTRPDTIFGVSYLVIAPEHSILNDCKQDSIVEYQNKTRLKTIFERTELQKEKTGVRVLNMIAVNPINNKEIPVFISDYVVTDYGTGAVMAVPAHDERDFEFAKKFSLPIIPVIKGCEYNNGQVLRAFTGNGEHINSDFLNGLSNTEAVNKISEYLMQNKIGRKKINYKMKDWAFSRQRYWGEPIPMVYCEKCGWVPLDEKDLPLKLPDIKDYLPTENGESPLAKCIDWVNTKCPKCGGDAKRETDTMPQWAGSCWYFMRYMDSNNNNKFASNEKLNYWGQVDWYNGGNEHATRHLLYSRFWYRALKDSGVDLPFDEPYAKRTYHGLVLAENGVKMSKSKGNVIVPDDIVEKYGADTLRTYIMFIGPFTENVAWSSTSIMGVHRFLKKVWDLFDKVDRNVNPNEEDKVIINQGIKNTTDRILSMKFNTAISGLMEFANYMTRLSKIPFLMYSEFIKLLSLFAPYMCDEIWEKLGNKTFLLNEKFSIIDEKYLISNTINIPVSINGKKRSVVNVKSGIDIDELANIAKQDPAIKKYLNGDIKKIISIKDKFINFII